MWQKAVAPYVKSGELVAIGVVQEQHPDRAALYKQWRQLDWPIFVDAQNLLDLTVVPVPVLIDASGIVRSGRRRASPRSFAADFMEKEFPRVEIPKETNIASKPDLEALKASAKKAHDARAWRDLGDAAFLNGKMDLAVEAHGNAIARDGTDARAHFRLGVALRRRSESASRRSGDAQAAVAHWEDALALNPRQYIWRRRIQQYGPRLDKPYNFFFWVTKAREEIRKRGETPVALAVEPMGSEVAAPRRRGSGDGEVGAPKNIDPDGKLPRDTIKMVTIEPLVTPPRVRPGHRIRFRATLRLDPKTKPYWNNEGDPVSLWLDLPDALKIMEGSFTHDPPKEAETQELRVMEFEIAVDRDAAAGPLKIPAYAVYGVCENEGGVCTYLRQDFTVRIEVDPKAPTIR